MVWGQNYENVFTLKIVYLIWKSKNHEHFVLISTCRLSTLNFVSSLLHFCQIHNYFFLASPSFFHWKLLFLPNISIYLLKPIILAHNMVIYNLGMVWPLIISCSCLLFTRKIIFCSSFILITYLFHNLAFFSKPSHFPLKLNFLV